ncbi:MAG: LEA type 2 family protein [Woeseiaceae bacterium]
MKMLKTIRAALLATLVLLSGCETIAQSLSPPDVRLSNVRVQEISSTSQQFQLTFAVSNPNAIALPVRAINYGVELGGLSLASGSTSEAFRVPANGDGEFSITVEASLIETVRLLGTRLLSGGAQSLDYSVGGDVDIDLPFVKPLPFSSSGTVSIAR